MVQVTLMELKGQFLKWHFYEPPWVSLYDYITKNIITYYVSKKVLSQDKEQHALPYILLVTYISRPVNNLGWQKGIRCFIKGCNLLCFIACSAKMFVKF